MLVTLAELMGLLAHVWDDDDEIVLHTIDGQIECVAKDYPRFYDEHCIDYVLFAERTIIKVS